MAVILATQELGLGGSQFEDSPGQIVHKALSQKTDSHMLLLGKCNDTNHFRKVRQIFIRLNIHLTTDLAISFLVCLFLRARVDNSGAHT
jgi:hypothetical protein